LASIASKLSNEEILEAFQAFDLDKNGLISLREFKNVLTEKNVSRSMNLESMMQ